MLLKNLFWAQYSFGCHIHGHVTFAWSIGDFEHSAQSWEKSPHYCEPVEKFLEFHSMYEGETKNDEACLSDGSCLNQYVVPLSLIERWGSAMGIPFVSIPCKYILSSFLIPYSTHLCIFWNPWKSIDIVYPDSKRCCCFTKSYYRYVKGTGSLLATVQRERKGKTSSLKEQCLRYFTPREVANLHSFPDDFNFPEHISLRQRYVIFSKLVFCLSPCEKAGWKCLKVRLQIRIFEFCDLPFLPKFR